MKAWAANVTLPVIGAPEDLINQNIIGRTASDSAAESSCFSRLTSA